MSLEEPWADGLHSESLSALFPFRVRACVHEWRLVGVSNVDKRIQIHLPRRMTRGLLG